MEWFLYERPKKSSNYILSAITYKHPEVNSDLVDVNTEDNYQNVNTYYWEKQHVEFYTDHLKKLDTLCLLDEHTLIDNMCLNINDMNFLSLFIMRNEKSEISQDCLIVHVAVGSAVKKLLTQYFIIMMLTFNQNHAKIR